MSTPLNRMLRICFIVILSAEAFSLSAREIAFFYALDADLAAFRRTLGVTPTNETVSRQTLSHFQLEGARVTATKMGSGAVQSAISAQILLTGRPIDLAFSVGPVGGLMDSFRPSQIGVVREVVPWQSIYWTPQAYPNSGFQALLPRNPPEGLSISNQLLTTPMIVASGEAFISDPEARSAIREVTRAQVVDMNLYGLLKVLEREEIPSLHLRIVSDSASLGASEQFAVFLESYDGRLGAEVAKIIQNLPEDKTRPTAFPTLKALIEESLDSE